MTETPTPDAEPAARLNPNALSVADAARMLTKVGGLPVTVDMIRADHCSGAPANPDGTVNLVHYCAWLVRECRRRSKREARGGGRVKRWIVGSIGGGPSVRKSVMPCGGVWRLGGGSSRPPSQQSWPGG
jgi:hypothetical protein